jgi:hypothetical protein
MTDNPYIALALNDSDSVERAIDELIALLDHLDPDHCHSKIVCKSA